MADRHPNTRLEAFCDGVFAIALTLLIVDIKLSSPESIGSTADLWRAIRELGPSIGAFVLSFGVILITWVNHHAFLKLVHRSTSSFIYANGFLLLTIVFIPFPTVLLGEFVWTDHAAPAVVLYDAVLSVQAIAWVLLAGIALKNQLANDETSALAIRGNKRNAYFAFVLYSLLAFAALWFPLTVAIVTTMLWIYWLVLSVRLHQA